MNKSTLATILGVAGLSLLKKASGSNSKLPESRIGTIFFILKPYLEDPEDPEDLEEQYGESALLSDFYSTLVDFSAWNKKYGDMRTWQILEDNGIEDDENGDLIYPEGEARFIQNVLSDNFESAFAIEENWSPIYAINTDIFRILNNVSRGFLSVKLLDNSMILEVNVVQLIEKMDHSERGKRNTIEEIFDYIKDYISDSIGSVCNVLGHYIYHMDGVNIDVGCTIEMIGPSNKLWFPALLTKKKSELRKF